VAAGAVNHASCSSAMARIAGMAFGWIKRTISFGSHVRKLNNRWSPSVAFNNRLD
jgi:hypothetical protein